MKQPFDVSGTAVSVEALLALQTLAVDLKRIRNKPVLARRIGEQRSKFRGQGREFIEMKRYQSGDDVRQIDWRLTAKKQSPFVRVMEEDRHAEHIIWLSLNAQQYFGTHKCFKSVLACHWAAFLCWRFVQLKHPVRLIIQRGDGATDEFKVTSSRHASHACQKISEAHQWLAQHFRDLPKQTIPVLPLWHGSPTVWLISDFIGTSIATLKQHCLSMPTTAVHCLQTLDAFDRHLPNAGELPVRHGDSFGVIQSHRASTQRAYEKSFQTRQQSLNEFCWQLNGAFISHDVDKFSWQEVRQWPLYH